MVPPKSRAYAFLSHGYSHKKGGAVEKSRLLFTFNNKRHDFTMGNYDIIDVVWVDSYRCARRICCNPNSALKVE